MFQGTLVISAKL